MIAAANPAEGGFAAVTVLALRSPVVLFLVRRRWVASLVSTFIATLAAALAPTFTSATSPAKPTAATGAVLQILQLLLLILGEDLGELVVHVLLQRLNLLLLVVGQFQLRRQEGGHDLAR